MSLLVSQDLPTRTETPARILDAAFECISRVGLGRTTVEDVARAAGLARQTIYRYFPSKEHLLLALMLREEEKFLDGVRRAFAGGPDLQRALEEGTRFCLRFAREHPLLDRLLETDAETLLPYLTTRGGPVIVRAREVFRSLLARKSWGRASLVDSAADAVVRVMISYALTPPDRSADMVAGDLARILTVALTGKEVAAR
jgi:AcrR family transcriptional regulator